MRKYKHSENFDTPIILIIFRRKDTALKVIGAISKVKPKTLYISQDGPRNDKERSEIIKTRKAVLSKINWKCDLTIWTHDKNLGLKKHIPDALNKFFMREEMGIYLEDDTLPSENFFYFERELLNKYKDYKKILSINGTNFYSDSIKPTDSYYLSKIGDIWGFGLWRRSWLLYNPNISDFNNVSKQSEYKKYFFNKKYKFYLETFWKAIIANKLDSWAMQWVYTAVKNNMYFINPSVNLVNNIGIANRYTNPSLQKYDKTYGTPFPLKHPKHLLYNSLSDEIYFSLMLRGGWLRLIANNIYLKLNLKLKKYIAKRVTQAMNLHENK